MCVVATEKHTANHIKAGANLTSCPEPYVGYVLGVDVSLLLILLVLLLLFFILRLTHPPSPTLFIYMKGECLELLWDMLQE